MKNFAYRNKGFSLIEIMIVIVIISILTSLAAVSYRAYIVKARRAAVQEELLSLQQKMEEYYTLNHTYNDAEVVGCAKVHNWGNVAKSGFYVLTCSTSGGYNLVAEATGKQKSDDADCAVLQLLRNGVKKGGKNTATGSMKEDQCW